MQERYGIDVDEPGLLRARSWRWLRVRILGLASAQGSLLHAALYRDET